MVTIVLLISQKKYYIPERMQVLNFSTRTFILPYEISGIARRMTDLIATRNNGIRIKGPEMTVLYSKEDIV